MRLLFLLVALICTTYAAQSQKTAVESFIKAYNAKNVDAMLPYISVKERYALLQALVSCDEMFEGYDERLLKKFSNALQTEQMELLQTTCGMDIKENIHFEMSRVGKEALNTLKTCNSYTKVQEQLLAFLLLNQNEPWSYEELTKGSHAKEWFIKSYKKSECPLLILKSRKAVLVDFTLEEVQRKKAFALSTIILGNITKKLSIELRKEYGKWVIAKGNGAFFNTLFFRNTVLVK